MNRKHNIVGGKVPESRQGYEASAAVHTDGSQTAQVWNEAQKYSSRAYEGLATQAQVDGKDVNVPTPQQGMGK